MEIMIKNYIFSTFAKSAEILKSMSVDQILINELHSAAIACVNALKKGNKILLAGNGGSAADAQHIAGEFVSRFAFDRPGLSAFALTTDTSILTAVGNDYGYEKIFSRQIQSHARKNDILIAYSTSGKSKNILNALEIARSLDVICIGMSGNRESVMKSLCNHYLVVPSDETPRIQEGHALLGHMLCGLVESMIFGDPV